MTKYEHMTPKEREDIVKSVLTRHKEKNGCGDCAIYDFCRECKKRPCSQVLVEYFDSDYIPKKTEKDLFFERYPKAKKDRNGYPLCCAKNILGTESCNGNIHCDECNEQYWDREVEE